MSLVDVKLAALKHQTSSTGSITDLENQYLRTLTSSTGGTRRLWMLHFDNEAIASGAFVDRARAFLIGEGIAAGSLNRMWLDYWTTLLPP